MDTYNRGAGPYLESLANFSSQLVAGRLPRAGLKPLSFLPRCTPSGRLQTPPAEFLVSCGKRPAALVARTRGLATAE